MAEHLTARSSKRPAACWPQAGVRPLGRPQRLVQAYKRPSSLRHGGPELGLSGRLSQPDCSRSRTTASSGIERVLSRLTAVVQGGGNGRNPTGACRFAVWKLACQEPIYFSRNGIAPTAIRHIAVSCAKLARGASICYQIEQRQFAGIDPSRHPALVPPAQTIPGFGHKQDE